MRKALFLALFWIGCLAADSFDWNPDLGEEEQNPLVPSGNTEAVILDGIDFALDLFRVMEKGTEGNFAFSPYAISSAMGMVFNGAEGITQGEMVKAMRFKVRLWYLNEAFYWLSNRYAYRPQETGSDILLSVSNALWLQRGVTLKPEYQTIVEAFYLTPIRYSNFSLYPAVARADINSWIRDRTKGRIPFIFEPKDLSLSPRMLMVSACYLRAKWANQFEPRVTRGTPFFPMPGRTIIVPTMVKTSIFSYLETPEFSVVELPYNSRKPGSKKLSMMILLPKETFGLTKVLDKLTAEGFQSALKLMQPAAVIVSIPKFSLNNSYTMNGMFSQLGLTSLFKPEANLKGMTEEALYMNLFFHKCIVANDEAGSDAGNPYAVASPPVSGSIITNPALFTADHPFLFAIVDVEAKTVLFMGRINHP